MHLIKTKTTRRTAILTAAGTALSPNEARASYKINNLGTNPLFVKEGPDASTSSFDYILAAGTGNDNGTGASYDSPQGQCYTGIITVAGTNPRFLACEREEN